MLICIKLDYNLKNIFIKKRGVPKDEKKAEEYFFSKLNDLEQQCYKKILFAIEHSETEVQIKKFLKNDELIKILDAINYDYPELFYINFKSVNFTKVSFGLILYINYNIEHEFKMMKISVIEEKINYIVLMALNQKLNTDYEKCRWIHNYLVKNVRYHFEAVKYPDKYPEAFRIDGVFKDNMAVCEGIAKAFKILCDRLDVKCLIAFGTASLKYFGKEMPHAWNIVKINEQFMHIDVTWDIGISEPSKHTRYDYFCISDKYLKIDHIYSGFPLCQTDIWSYFYKKKRIFSSANQLKNYLEIELKQNNNILYFKIVKDENLPQNIENKITNLVNKLVSKYFCSTYYIEMIPNQNQMCFFYRIKRWRGEINEQ